MKRRPNNSQSYKKVISSLLLLATPLVGYLAYSVNNSKTDKEALPSTPNEATKGVVKGIDSTQVLMPIWQDFNWKSAYRLSITNSNENTLKKSTEVVFEFDHEELVDLGVMAENAKDLRLFYQANNTVKSVNFTVKNLDSTKAELRFALQEDIEGYKQVGSYFLYFNNKEASLLPTPLISPTSITNTETIKATLDKEFQRPFNAEISRKWLLKGINIPQEYQSLTGNIEINSEFAKPNSTFSWEVKGTQLKSIPSSITPGIQKIQINPLNLPVGTYELVLKLDNQTMVHQFNVSYPLYMTWTMDWEGMDVKDEYLRYMDTIAVQNNMPITHFFSPRIYLTSTMSPQRSQYLTNWVKQRAAKYGDSIDMHLHMHHDFIESAGVTPKKELSWAGQADGYDVPTTVYSTDELEKIVGYGLQLFQQNGLPKPIGYRAGGWHLSAHGLQAIENLGFKYDSSGREALSFGKNNLAVPWNLKSTTQPYIMSKTDTNSSNGPLMKLWQFPNNGLDSTNYKAEDMLRKFNDNYQGKPLANNTTVTFLSHPQWFNNDKPRLEELFATTNKSLAEKDLGPVLYVTLDELYEVYSAR